jgi:WD40 repeat protein
MCGLWRENFPFLVATIDIGEEINSLTFSNDILANGTDGNIRLYDLKARKVITSLQFPNLCCLALSPTRLAAGEEDGTVHLLDIRVSTIVTTLAFSPYCSRLASGYKDGTIRLWDTVRTEIAMAARRLHSQEITALAFSLDGKKLASASEDGTVKLWDGGNGAPNGVVQHSFYNVPTSIALLSHLLAVATYHSIILFNCKSLDFVYAFPQGSNICLSFSSDGSRLASAYNYESSADVPIWDVEKQARIAKFNIDSTIERMMLLHHGSRNVLVLSK